MVYDYILKEYVPCECTLLYARHEWERKRVFKAKSDKEARTLAKKYMVSQVREQNSYNEYELLHLLQVKYVSTSRTQTLYGPNDAYEEKDIPLRHASGFDMSSDENPRRRPESCSDSSLRRGWMKRSMDRAVEQVKGWPSWMQREVGWELGYGPENEVEDKSSLQSKRKTARKTKL